jgi:hypothetical protein
MSTNHAGSDESGDALDTYYARAEQVETALTRLGLYASCGAIADLLGWRSHEVRAKLVYLRNAGVVRYHDDVRMWEAT